MTREQERLICEYYQRPLGLVPVSRLAGTSVTTVRRILSEWGVKLRPVGATLAKAARL